MEEEKKSSLFLGLKKNLLPVVVISLIIGGLAGGAAGILTSSLYSGSFSQWFGNPLGLSSLLHLNDSDSQQSQSAQNNQTSVAPVTVQEETSTTAAVSQVSPAVVSIIISKELQQYYSFNNGNSPFGDIFGFPFDQFFNQQELQQPQSPSAGEKQKIGGGTGFIISSDGLIITNKHVVADTAADYSVVLADGSTHNAVVVGRDPLNDLAFLKIDGQNLPIVELGDSDNLQIGQTVIAIGFSLGEYSNTVTKGIVSGIGRTIEAGDRFGGQTEKLEDVIQTAAAINPGNSGGPLINLQGQVVGINTAINSQGQLIGFAIPINNAKQVIQVVRKNGKIIRPYIGVRYILLTEQIAKQNNLNYSRGALILRGNRQGELAVAPGSPADQAGLTENDIILEINGIVINPDHSLTSEIAKYQAGTVVNLKVVHDGAEKNLNLELAEYPEN